MSFTMQGDRLRLKVIIFSFLFLSLFVIVPQAMSQPCAVSPRSGGITILPNTLLIVDNSGSMLWAAYPDDYSNSTTYYGLFDPTKTYRYDSTNDYFEEDSGGSWSGSFLNWATITRWDVAVYVITGQNYVDLSGDRYLVSNGDNRYSHTSFTDHHWYTDTDDVTPYDSSDGSLRYRPVPHYYNSLLSNEHWSYLDVYDGSSHDYYYLRIKVALDYQPQGLLHSLENKVRLGLMHFNDNDGGFIRRYVNKLDSTQLANVIADLHRPLVDSTSNFSNYISTTWTPLAETLYEATRYFQQVSPEFSGYTVADSTNPERDPYYYEEYGDEVWCAKSHVIIVTDGESTKDRDSSIPAGVRTADGDDCDSNACPCEISTTCRTKYNCIDSDSDSEYCDDEYPFDSDNGGSAYLDDVAYYAFNTDLRPAGDKNLDDDQHITTHTVFVFGTENGVGEALLENTADNSEGMYRLALNANDLIDALEEIFKEITQKAAAAASVAITSEPVSGTNLNLIYIPYYKNPEEYQWIGNIRGFRLDDNGYILAGDTGSTWAVDQDDDFVLDDPKWDAAEALVTLGSNNREIFTYISGVKEAFETSNATLDKYFDVDDLNNDATVDGSDADALISYVRGNDNPTGLGNLRVRDPYYVGDIMHASPIFVGKPSGRFDLIYGDMIYV